MRSASGHRELLAQALTIAKFEPQLYEIEKGAIQNFTGGLAQMLAEKGIRANAGAPGPIWTPLIPSTMPDDTVKNFGKQVPMKRPGQPAELATAHVMLADPLSSFTSGTTVAVTGGNPSRYNDRVVAETS